MQGKGDHIATVISGLEEVERVKILFSFSGELNTKNVDTSLVELEDLLSTLDLKKSQIKRIFSLAIEGLQNIERHGIEHPEFSGVSFFVFYETTHHYGLVFANLVDDETKSILASHLERVVGLSQNELKEAFMHQLSNGEMTEKGGGGLGMLTLAMKSSQPIRGLFTTLEAGMLHIFSVRAVVDKD